MRARCSAEPTLDQLSQEVDEFVQLAWWRPGAILGLCRAQFLA
jgi:hypothetical protein